MCFTALRSNETLLHFSSNQTAVLSFISLRVTVSSPAMLKACCCAHHFQSPPRLADHVASCAKELPLVYGNAHVTADIKAESRKLLLVVSDSTLKVNRSSGSRWVEGSMLRQSLHSDFDEYSVLVAVWAGRLSANLEELTEAVAGITNIDRLVLVWQGNEYERMLPPQLPAYVRTHFAIVHFLVDSVVFVLPAPDEVWNYGTKYEEFAAVAQGVALSDYRATPELDLTIPLELRGKTMPRSHLNVAHLDELVQLVAKWC